MIIFYEKKTREIFGVISGRVHSKDEIEKVSILGSNMKKEDVGKYVVPFKTKYKMVEQPKTEMRVVNKKTMRVEKVVIGKERVKVGAGMIPDVPSANLISNFESGKKSPYDYKVKLDKKKVIGFEKKSKS